MHNAVVLVDSRAAAMKESGDIILSKVGLQPSPAPANLLPSLCRRKSLLRLGRCSQSECMYHSHQERSLCSSPLVGGRPGGLPPPPPPPPLPGPVWCLTLPPSLPPCAGMAIEDVASATLVFQRYQEEQRQQRQPAGSS